jgi:hypothetical protein
LSRVKFYRIKFKRLLCNGTTFTDNATNAQLKALLGSTTTPNLNGMFLRGTGNTGTTGQDGPLLKQIQQDATKSHLHSVSINTTSGGEHTHTTTFANDDYNNSGGGTWGSGLLKDAPYTTSTNHTLNTSASGAHTHSVSGNTALTGGTETRPVNYGVTYIIKI